MRRAMLRRNGALVPALLVTTILAGCDGSPPPPPQNFPAVHYDYLTPLRLNVADVEVEDGSSPPDGDLAGRSPVKPAQAMQQMAHDRLIAAGGSGTATFVVTEASITRTDNGITEHLAARLEISNAGGGHAGFAEAHVTRTETPGNGEPAGPASLYELTRQAMEDMNVEFEYQVRHTLHDWLITNGAVEAPVEQAPLTAGAPGSGGAPLPLAPMGAPPAAPSAGFTPGAPTTLAPPPPAGAASPGALSPPPGYPHRTSGRGTRECAAGQRALSAAGRRATCLPAARILAARLPAAGLPAAWLPAAWLPAAGLPAEHLRARRAGARHPDALWQRAAVEPGLPAEPHRLLRAAAHHISAVARGRRPEANRYSP